ncbi:hypothetical protein ACOBQJ_01820 [Pelotomaculum propionicicum]|uniref:hypothetical protein n=1 Tax=Pelotomaculum propionicicum TaxID=258475 RepID=UPI003B795F2C
MIYNVSIYKDKKDNILLIPYVFDEHGIRRKYNKPVTLEKPYQSFVIGKSVRECFKVSIETKCQQSEQAVNVWQIATGIKSWYKFSKERLCVSGKFNPEEGYTFLPLKRQSDGSYTPEGIEIIHLTAGLDAPDEEIGELVLKAFSFLDNKVITSCKEEIAEVVIKEAENGKKQYSPEYHDNGNPKPEKPEPFGYNCAWLAIKTQDIDKVAKALELKNIRVANWTDGVEAWDEFNGEVFVSPPLGDWTIVIGISLPDMGDSRHPDKLTPLILKLSNVFDEVQYFGTQRTSEYHAWAKARNGVLIRAYAYVGDCGQTACNVGEKTIEEKKLGFNFFNEKSLEARKNGYWDREDLRYPREFDVLSIAREWSTDTLFESEEYPPGLGLIGLLPKIL